MTARAFTEKPAKAKEAGDAPVKKSAAGKPARVRGAGRALAQGPATETMARGEQTGKPAKATNERAATGKAGEELAARLLEDAGYAVVARNFRARGGEIDVIAQSGTTIVFAEVKTRAEGGFGSPAEAVDARKMRRIVSTAQLWLMAHPCVLQPRFDVIEVLVSPNKTVTYNHIENAFGAF